MSEIIEQAKLLALDAHKNQKYFTTDKVMPMSWHLEKTADLAKRLGYGEEVMAACWLHDIVEDTTVTLSYLKQHFPEDIVAAVDSVTFDSTKDKDKIEKAKQNPIGHVVKFCDASINYAATALLGPKPGLKQWNITVERYLDYLVRLSKNLPTPEEIHNNKEVNNG
jgi:(p)ppGpp synthase/HD superfamily hydrolase